MFEYIQLSRIPIRRMPERIAQFCSHQSHADEVWPAGFWVLWNSKHITQLGFGTEKSCSLTVGSTLTSTKSTTLSNSLLPIRSMRLENAELVSNLRKNSERIWSWGRRATIASTKPLTPPCVALSGQKRQRLQNEKNFTSLPAKISCELNANESDAIPSLSQLM